ncbi:hypothetical protein L1887_22695 [Cichorium endivia]|nr:hypothetical protein L1887_22695 [Cichorium endivia]
MNSEAKANNTVKEGKPPTRLQKQAPATLQCSETTNNGLWNSSKTVIPLLSPLVLSPAPLPDATVHHTRNSFFTPNNNHDANMNHQTAIGIIPQVQQSIGGSDSSSEWRHPAMAGPTTDTSSLNAYFQSQCVLRPRKQ